MPCHAVHHLLKTLLSAPDVEWTAPLLQPGLLTKHSETFFRGVPVQWVMLSNLTHLRELHLLDKEYFKVLLNAVVCSSTHLSHKMRRTGAPSPAQPETSTGKSRCD